MIDESDPNLMPWELYEDTVLRNPYVLQEPSEKQAEFLRLEHKYALYGGAGGGGKSSALLMAALQFCHGPEYKGYAALIVRRKLTDLEQAGGLIHRALTWLEPKLKRRGKGGTVEWNGAKYRLNFPNGTSIQFGYCDNEGDEHRYHGAEYQCVARGSLIRMGDGSLEPIENVKVGDDVLTLEGPRRVTATSGARFKPCVAARVYGPDRLLIGEQIHPEDHPILTRKGWRSFSDIVGDARPSASYEPTQCHACGRRARSAAGRFRTACTPLCSSSAGQQPRGARFQSPLGRPRGAEFASWSANGRNGYAATHATLQGLRPLQELCVRVTLHAPRTRCGDKHSNGYGVADAPLVSSAPSSRCCCWTCRRRGGGQSHRESATGTSATPLPVGAEALALAPMRLDALAPFPKRNPRCQASYIHPYTMEERACVEGVRLGTCVMSPVGEREVYDLTVDRANHYISASSLINRNCIALDEAVQFTPKQIAFFMTERLRKTHDVSVPLRFRAGTTPGGVGHEFLKDRFIDPGTPGYQFVSATLTDNPHLPADYEDSLAEYKRSDPLRYRQMLSGDWNAVDGGRFKREWFGRWEPDRNLADTVILRDSTGAEVERFRPEQCGRFQTCDPAISTNSKADNFVLSTFLLSPRANLVWLHCQCGKYDFPRQIELCKQLYRQFQPQFLGVEDVAYQRALIEMLQRSTAPVMIVKPLRTGGQDKLARAAGAISLAASRRVFLPAIEMSKEENPTSAMLSELLAFTGEKKGKDDITDTFAYACSLLPFVRAGHNGSGSRAPFRHAGNTLPALR